MAGGGTVRTPSGPSSNHIYSDIKGSMVSGLSLDSAEERLDVSLVRAGRSFDGFVLLRVRSALDSSIDVPKLLIDNDFGACCSSSSERGREESSAAMRRGSRGPLWSLR